jgi:hypothetical protein
MLSKLRMRLTYANVVASIALFVALGGTSYGLATGSIGSREIKNNGVASKDIRNNDVRGKDIRNSTISSRDVRNGALLAEDFMAGALPAGEKGEKGDKGDPGAPGERGPSEAFAQSRAFANGLTNSFAAAPNPIAQLSLPAGQYLIFAQGWFEHADLVDTETYTLELTGGGDPLNVLTKSDTELERGTSPGWANASLLYAANLPAATTIELRAANNGGPGSIHDATLAAIRVGSLN